MGEKWGRNVYDHGNTKCQRLHKKTILTIGFLSVVVVAMIAYHGVRPTHKAFMAKGVSSEKLEKVEERTERMEKMDNRTEKMEEVDNRTEKKEEADNRTKKMERVEKKIECAGDGESC